MIELARQYRWYAYARQRESPRRVVGLILDERLNRAPQPPKRLKSGKVSVDQDQVTTGKMYLDACNEVGQEVDPALYLHFQQRIWQQRVYLLFRPDELREAGLELTSAARGIRDLDSGATYPVRNSKAFTCNFCRFRRCLR